MKFSIFTRLTLPITLLALGAFCQNASAQWSTLHGNNRSALEQFAPRPQSPPVNHAPPTVYHAPAPQIHEQPRVVEPVRQPSAPVDRVREQPHPVVHTQAAETDRRRMDIDEDRRQSYYWSDYRRGMRVDRLPDGYHRFRFHDHDYFYFEGVFYDSGPSGYVVIDPPIDADIPDVPPGAETVVVNGTVYYYVDGAFYVQQADGSYVVVAAPIGVTVSMLSPDATAVVINGATYYQADGTYYLPVMQNGVTAYLTVAQPG